MTRGHLIDSTCTKAAPSWPYDRLMVAPYVKTAWDLAQEYATRSPERIAREMGITVLELPMSRVYGLAAALGEYRLIGVKADLPERAKKLVVGHELGHFVLHPEGGFFFVLTKTLFYNRWEYQANMFAAALILGDDFAKYEAVVRELAAGRADKLIKMLK